jgi:HD-like signal output (HDOD) protein
MNTSAPSKDYYGAVSQNIHTLRKSLINPAERYLNDVTTLPPAPTVLSQLLTLFREPDRDIDQVVQLITYEASLTAQVMRACNSVHFAGGQPPSDIFEAVTRIGFYHVYTLVVNQGHARR